MAVRQPVPEVGAEVVLGIDRLAKDLQRPWCRKELAVRKEVGPVAEGASPLLKRVDLIARRAVHVGDRESFDSEATVELVAADEHMDGGNLPIDLVDVAGRVDQPERGLAECEADPFQEVMVAHVWSAEGGDPFALVHQLLR